MKNLVNALAKVLGLTLGLVCRFPITAHRGALDVRVGHMALTGLLIRKGLIDPIELRTLEDECLAVLMLEGAVGEHIPEIEAAIADIERSCEEVIRAAVNMKGTEGSEGKGLP